MTELFVKNALCGEKLSLYGKSEGKRDYIYVKDACLGIKKALEAYEKTGIYNIGSGIGTTSKQLAESVIKGFNSVSETVQLTDKKEDTSISFLDVTKAKLAALLHDISGVMTPQEMYDFAKNYPYETIWEE